MVKSAERTVDIIEFAAGRPGGATHTEIAEALSIPGSSMNALLDTLVRKECMAYDPETKKFSIGPKILYLAGRYIDQYDLVAVGRPFLKQLLEKTNESVALAVAAGPDIQFVDRFNSKQAIMGPLQVGAHSPMYATSAGKAILATWSDEDVNEYLRGASLVKLTAKTLTDPDAIRLELEAIRRGRVAKCLEGVREGVNAYSRPVLSFQGDAIGAVAVSIPAVRDTNEYRSSVTQALIEMTDEFSKRLGCPSELLQRYGRKS